MHIHGTHASTKWNRTLGTLQCQSAMLCRGSGRQACLFFSRRSAEELLPDTPLVEFSRSLWPGDGRSGLGHGEDLAILGVEHDDQVPSFVWEARVSFHDPIGWWRRCKARPQSLEARRAARVPVRLRKSELLATPKGLRSLVECFALGAWWCLVPKCAQSLRNG